MVHFKVSCSDENVLPWGENDTALSLLQKMKIIFKINFQKIDFYKCIRNAHHTPSSKNLSEERISILIKNLGVSNLNEQFKQGIGELSYTSLVVKIDLERYYFIFN